MNRARPADECTAEAVGLAAVGLGFRLPDSCAAGLAAYLVLLMKWNRVMNLVGPGDWRTVFETLIIDSLHLARFLEALPLPEKALTLDLGAGAGLPGVALRMLWRRGEYVMVESREKRALFLRAVLAAVPLPGVSVFHGRAEDCLGRAAPPDLVVSRAFLPWPRVLSLVAGAVAAQGHCVFLTLEPLPRTLPGGWFAAREESYTVRGDTRFFWLIQKISVSQG
ncbi:MAG: class I SAM-dependent methyltransferase [Desulfovibrio sp.]|jgi:16S rRNA (guanine527-N7)-methyltransferase|nr:class I SAM-dependent methyltransferase [Desulfovibrio sp.]